MMSYNMEDKITVSSNEVSHTAKVNNKLWHKKYLIYQNSQKHNCDSEMFTILSTIQKKSKSWFPILSTIQTPNFILMYFSYI